MPTVEQIIEQIRTAAGADFAFILTRKGRLCTSRAPKDMPEVGRDRIVRAAKPLVGSDRVATLTMAREDLVPYGGAAPVDVYLGVAAEQAIVCAVMATWADKTRIGPAVVDGLADLEPLLRRGVSQARGLDVAPAKGSPFRGAPPPTQEAVQQPAPAMSLDLSSGPDGRVADGEPSVDAEPKSAVVLAPAPPASATARTAVPVLLFRGGTRSSPEITYGQARPPRPTAAGPAERPAPSPHGSAPEIVIEGEAKIGRETLVAIQEDGRPTSSPEGVRLDLASGSDLRGGDAGEGVRSTVPWTESAADAKRAADAEQLARKHAPPALSIHLEEADDAVMDAARAELEVSEPRPAQRTLAYDNAPPKPLPPKVRNG